MKTPRLPILCKHRDWSVDGSHVTVDAMVFYDFDKLRLKLNLKNLTDEEYERRGFGAGSVVPADPFAVYASVEFRQ